MPKTYYMLLHHHHLPTAEDPAVPDLYEDGEPLYWDDNEDCVKILGLYSSRALAETRIEQYRQLPGFREAPEHFAVHPYVLDRPCWTAGFQVTPGP